MTTLRDTMTTGTPAPRDSQTLLEDPFAWACDATYVLLPVVKAPRSEALDALRQRSMYFVSVVDEELARHRDLRLRMLGQQAREAVSATAARVSSAASDALSRLSRQADVAPTTPQRTTHPGTEALDQLQAWLGLPLDDLMGIVGLSTSTRQYWRNHPEAAVRPAKAGRLLRFRTSVGLLVGALGVEQARHVMHAEDWLKPLDEARLVAFEARVRAELSPEPRRAPAGLAGLTRSQLLAGVADRTEEVAQRRLESSRGGEAVGSAQEDDAG